MLATTLRAARIASSCAVTLVLAACAGNVEIKPGRLLQAFDEPASQSALPLVDLGGPAKPTVYMDGRQTVLLREFHLRSGTAPTVEQLARNVNAGDPMTPPALQASLRAFAAANGDGFKQRDAAIAMLGASKEFLRTAEPLQRVAVWHSVAVRPYDFQRQQYEVCLSPSCTGQPGNDLILGLGARDYRLVLRNLPPVISLEPGSEVSARRIEADAAMQTPRGMTVLLLIDLLPQAGANGVVYGQLAGMAYYERGRFGQTRMPPSRDRLILVHWMSPDSPRGPSVRAAALVKPTNTPAPEPTRPTSSVDASLLSQIGLVPSKRSPGYFESDDGCRPVEASMQPFDLRSGNLRAVMATVTEGPQSICFGSTGGRTVLLLEDRIGGKFRAVMDVGGTGAFAVAPHAGSALPDLVSRAPACDAVWRWNGARYLHHANVPTRAGGCQSRAR